MVDARADKPCEKKTRPDDRVESATHQSDGQAPCTLVQYTYTIMCGLTRRISVSTSACTRFSSRSLGEGVGVGSSLAVLLNVPARRVLTIKILAFKEKLLPARLL